MKVLKISIGAWQNASRDKRELSVAQELGADVVVIAKGEQTGHEDVVDGFRVLRCSTRPVKWMPISLNRVLSIFTWAAFSKKQNADIISGHDYIALLIGWLSNVGKRHKAKLIYDSHEFELGHNAARSKFHCWCIYQIEHLLIKRWEFSIMVNDIIADEVQRIYRLQERPVVVRNIAQYWELDQNQINAAREMFCKRLHAPQNAFLVMYHGGVTFNRGIEKLLHAMTAVPDAYVVILGNGEKAYVNSLHALCESLHLTERVLFYPAVPLNELRNYVAAANVGVVLSDPANPNGVYSLPNKFFENIQSMTPLIANDFPTMAQLIDQYQIGLKVEPANEGELSKAIERMKSDQTLYAACKENLKRAKEDLCWEKEKAVLVQAYSRVL